MSEAFGTQHAKLHVIWVNHFALTPSEGGGTRHFELGRELVRGGHEVSILASDFGLHTRRYSRRFNAADRRPITEQVEGVRFHWLWAAPYLHNDWRRLWNWLSFARSVWDTRRSMERPSLVIGSSPHLFAALAAERMATALGVPFVLEVRDLWPESLFAVSGRKGPTYYFFAVLARYLYSRARRIVVLARGSGEHLRRMGIDPAKIVFVPNGADVEAFANEARRVSTSRNRFVALYAGAHGPANGLDVVLDAAHLLRHREDILIRLVGDGPSKGKLMDEARRRGLANVEFMEPVSKSGMPALLASADAGLMVLRDTPLFAFGVSPNKLFDYLAAQLPVVCNVPGEVAQMLAAARAGVQAVDGSPEALASALEKMASTRPEERADMGRDGRQWIAREHGRGVVASRLLATLTGLTTQLD